MDGRRFFFRDYSALRIPHSALTQGQGMVEYLLVLVAVVLAVVVAVGAGGPIQTAVSGMLSDTSGVISGMATKVSQRF